MSVVPEEIVKLSVLINEAQIEYSSLRHDGKNNKVVRKRLQQLWLEREALIQKHNKNQFVPGNDFSDMNGLGGTDHH